MVEKNDENEKKWFCHQKNVQHGGFCQKTRINWDFGWKNGKNKHNWHQQQHGADRLIFFGPLLLNSWSRKNGSGIIGKIFFHRLKTYIIFLILTQKWQYNSLSKSRWNGFVTGVTVVSSLLYSVYTVEAGKMAVVSLERPLFIN